MYTLRHLVVSCFCLFFLKFLLNLLQHCSCLAAQQLQYVPPACETAKKIYDKTLEIT